MDALPVYVNGEFKGASEARLTDSLDKVGPRRRPPAGAYVRDLERAGSAFLSR